MAFGKFFALFCISLAVFAPTEAASVRATGPELVAEVIKTVTDVLKQIILLGEDLVSGYSGDPEGVEASLINIVRELLVAIETNLQTKVDALGSALDPEGLILYNCFVDNRDDSNDHLLSFFTEFFSCANPSIKKVVDLVNPILEVLRTTDENCGAVSDDVAKCGETDFSCFITSVISILNELIAIPDNLEQPIGNLKDQASAVADDLKDCAGKGSDEWYTEFFQGIGVLKKCSDAK